MEVEEFQKFLNLELNKLIEYGKLYGFIIEGNLTCKHYVNDKTKGDVNNE